MNPLILLIAVLALVLLAAAVWLFGHALQKERQAHTQQHLQASLMRNRASPAPANLAGMEAAMMHGASTAGYTVGNKVLRILDTYCGFASWGISVRALVVLLVSGLCIVLLTSLQAGGLAGLLALACFAFIASFFIWRRLNKRRKQLLQQLPIFLDNMVRLITIGNSPHAAFQLASPNVPAPLGEALGQATATLSANSDMGNAMGQLEKSWSLPEFGLLAAVFRMSVRYGGRADLVLERVSNYIRDRQSAERELHALSAEVRLSAWILALLPIVVGALIMVLNASYFLRMWNDPSGQKMILVAAILEALGSFFLYRLARLK